jgi:hypothetical protein
VWLFLDPGGIPCALHRIRFLLSSVVKVLIFWSDPVKLLFKLWFSSAPSWTQSLLILIFRPCVRTWVSPVFGLNWFSQSRERARLLVFQS